MTSRKRFTKSERAEQAKELFGQHDFYSGKTPLKIVRHRTVTGILQALFAGPDGEIIPLRDLKAGTFGSGAISADGEMSECEITFDTYADTIRRTGFYGFADKKRGVVNVFISRRADPLEVAFFLGHEIGHTQGRQKSDEVAEEVRADRYGVAARQALEWMFDFGVVPSPPRQGKRQIRGKKK